MKSISTTLENFFQPIQLREDEYLDDGLIYCLKCGTLRQRPIEVFGKLYKPRCMCTCQAEAFEQREQERRHREFLDRVAKNRSMGLPDPELRKCTFENSLGYNQHQIRIAMKYVQNWDEFYGRSQGLIFWGDTGTGKSYLASAIGNALIDQGVSVLVTNFSRILNKLTDMYSSERNSYIDSLNAYPLLIIDDLGVERNSEFAREQVFNVIDSRYRTQLPMIVTTNLTIKELKSPADLGRKRIYDRILERCMPVRVNGQNIRELNAAMNLRRAKELLNEGEGNG